MPHTSPTETARFRDAVIEALDPPEHVLSPQWFYDARGAELFEQICQLDEYYPTRTELAILESCLEDVAHRVGPQALVFEPGSGAGLKTERLLAALDRPRGYVPIDVAEDQLEATSVQLGLRFPELQVEPMHADFASLERLPAFDPPPRRSLAFFPGSTIGNFAPADARDFLSLLARLAGERGAILLGVDLVKDTGTLERAYDDARGVTAAFNLNVLHRMRTELGAEIDVEKWRHRAIFNTTDSRIEMHLVSEAAQSIQIDDHRWSFAAGEHIVTEYSYKYTHDALQSLVSGAGLEVESMWTDARDWFAVLLLTPRPGTTS